MQALRGGHARAERGQHRMRGYEGVSCWCVYGYGHWAMRSLLRGLLQPPGGWGGPRCLSTLRRRVIQQECWRSSVQRVPRGYID